MRVVSRMLLICVLALAASTPAQAIVVNWDGEALASPWNWQDPVNWLGDVAPLANDDLNFPGSVTNRTTTNDFAAGTQFNGITIPGNAYLLQGNSINLGPNGVSFTAGAGNVSTISLATVLQQDTPINVAATTGSGRLQWDGVISGSFALNKTGAGMLRMSTNAKTYSGNTNVNQGMLDVSTDNMLPSGAGKGNVSVNTGGILNLNNITLGINGLNDGTGGAGSVTKSGSNSRTLTVGNGDANGSFSGAITFTGGTGNAINKTGSGTQTLGGTVTIPGAGNVNGGRLNINGSFGAGINVNNTGTLGGTGSITGGVVVASGGKVSPGTSIESLDTGLLTFNGTSTFEVEISSTAAVAAGADLVNANGALTISATSTITFTDLAGMSSTPIAPGTIFTLISYAGLWNGIAFSNAADDSMVTIGVNQFKLDYNDTALGANFGGGAFANRMTLTIPAAVPEASAFLFGALACALVPARRLMKRRHAAK